MEQKSEKTSPPINLKILALILGLALAYYIASYWVTENQFNEADVVYLTGILVCSISSFLVAKRYHDSQVFGRAYMFLGLGFLSWFIGDSLWSYYFYVLEIDPWPSPSDGFFLASYVFASLHLVINTRYFKRKWSTPMKMWVVIFPIMVTAIYLYFSYIELDNSEELFDWGYGSIFVFGSSVVLSLAIIGVSIFRQSTLGVVWLLLAFGLFLWTLADIWYVYDVIWVDEPPRTHPTNTIWIGAFMVITYALYKHQKII